MFPLNFVHRTIGGFIKGAITGGPAGALAGAAGGFVADRGAGGRKGGQPAVVMRDLGGGGRSPCPPGEIFRSGVCREPFNPKTAIQALVPGGGTGIVSAVGTAVMGRHGAALQPFVENRVTRSCLPGMVLGNDGLCYNRRDIRNSDRAYPRGTRPLGTPGEMASLRKAASFGRRMESTVKRMQKIGVLKKPAARKAAPKPKMLTAGDGVRVVNVE